LNQSLIALAFFAPEVGRLPRMIVAGTVMGVLLVLHFGIEPNLFFCFSS